MALFTNPEEHASNPPESWAVVKCGDRCWSLRTAHSGVDLEHHTTKRAAERAKVDGFSARLWDKERRWFAGEPVSGWKPYAKHSRDYPG